MPADRFAAMTPGTGNAGRSELTLAPPPLSVLHVGLVYRLQDPAQLPRWKGAMLRGGLGRALHGQMCSPLCLPDQRPGDPSPPVPDRAVCPLNHQCPYFRLFAPRVEEDEPGSAGKEGGHDRVRPFALQPPLDNKTHYARGESLHFGIMLAGTAIDYLAHVIGAYEALGRRDDNSHAGLGLGKERARAELTGAFSYDPLSAQVEALPLLVQGRLQSRRIVLHGEDMLARAAELPSRLRIHFITPMRIKTPAQHGEAPTRARSREEYIKVPQCSLMVRAILRRVTELCALYGDSVWRPDYTGLIRQAEAVRLADCRVNWVDWSRTSAATGQRMVLGGIVGSAVFEDVPPDVAALLLMGSMVHIGKATVFGHGNYGVEAAAT